MSGKGLLAIGLAVIAGVFLALVIQARRDEPSRRRDRRPERLELVEADPACEAAVREAVDAAGDRIEERWGIGARSEVQEIAVRRCHEDAWPTEVTSCLRDAGEASALSRCIGKLDPDASVKLMAELESIRRTDDDLDADDDPYGLPACMEYGRLIDRYATCDSLPEAAREALQDAYAQMQSAWSGIAASARASMNDACQQGVDAMKQAMAQMCP